MRLTKNRGLALILIVFGVFILLNGIGFGLGKLMGVMIPLALLLFGYIGIKNGKTFIGWSLAIVGIIMLISKLSGLIGLLLAIGFIWIGISMLRKGSNAY